MGTYSSSEWLETFGGLPEPGEAYPDDPDVIRDRLEEQEREHKLSMGPPSQSIETPAGAGRVPPHVPPRLAGIYDDEGDCTVCGAPVGKHHLSYCDLRGDV